MSDNARKFLISIKSLGLKVKERLPSILFWFGTGMAINGYVTTVKDHKRLNRLEKDHIELVKTFNGNVDQHNDFSDWTHDEIERLTRQNNELLERALRETEGKAS
jgi:hypothetical protein